MNTFKHDLTKVEVDSAPRRGFQTRGDPEAYKPLEISSVGYGQGQNRTADTRIFSPHTVPRLCVPLVTK